MKLFIVFKILISVDVCDVNNYSRYIIYMRERVVTGEEHGIAIYRQRVQVIDITAACSRHHNLHTSYNVALETNIQFVHCVFRCVHAHPSTCMHMCMYVCVCDTTEDENTNWCFYMTVTEFVSQTS